MTLNSPSFLERIGLKRKGKLTSEVTYFTCLKMLSETLAKMPIKYYQKTDKGIIEAEATDTSKLLSKRPNPFMTPTTFWNTVEINRNHYGNGYVYMRKKFDRKKFGGEIKIVDLWVMQSNCVQIVVDDAGIFAGVGRLWYVYTDPTSGRQYVFSTDEVMHFKTSFSFDGITGLPVQQILRDTVAGASESQAFMNNLYESGLTAKATLEYTGELNEKAKAALVKSFEEFGSGAKNTGKILPVPLGMISNCGHDENGRYSGGKAGDQTGTEWQVINWYSRPWKCVLRHPNAKVRADAKVRKMIASMAKAAAVNNKIGYCQSHRGTFWTNLADSNFDPAQITVACEADCSSGVAAIVKGAGYRLGIDALKKVSTACYTGNLRAALKAAGFEVLTENKYLTSDAYLLAGDILLNDGAHTATNLTDGAKSSGAGASNTTPVKSNTKVDVAHGFNKSLAGTYKVTASGLNLRAGAGTGKSILAVMNHDEKVQCYGYYNDCNGVKWLYVVYKNIVGYASSKYLSK